VVHTDAENYIFYLYIDIGAKWANETENDIKNKAYNLCRLCRPIILYPKDENTEESLKMKH